MPKNTHHYAGVALSLLFGMALSLPAHATEMWNVNVAKSNFGSRSNTLVLERANGKSTSQAIDAKNTAAGTFLVISNGKVYLAVDEAASNASSGLRTVDYTRWRDMKLVQIGENVRSADHCGFRCQMGLPDNRLTLTFKPKGVDARQHMNNIVVLNDK